MSKIWCPGKGCNFTSKQKGLVSKAFPDVYCPNCSNASLHLLYSDKVYKCNSCGMRWKAVPCPKCATLINYQYGVLELSLQYKKICELIGSTLKH